MQPAPVAVRPKGIARRLTAGSLALALPLVFAACSPKSTLFYEDPPEHAGAGGSGSDAGGGAGRGGSSGSPGSSGAADVGGGSGGTGGGGGSAATGTGGVAAEGGLGGTAATGANGGDGGVAAVGPSPVGPYTLVSAPLVFAPTATGFSVSVALREGDPSTLRLEIRESGSDTWGDPITPDEPASDVVEWTLDDLSAATRYEYRVLGTDGAKTLRVAHGSVVTRREPGAAFSFAMVSDTHVGSDLSFSNQGDPTVVSGMAQAIDQAKPDFMFNLGDTLDFHEFGFNTPPPDSSIAKAAYLNYRALLGDTVANLAHFNVLGGWDSENGCNTVEEIQRSRSQRLLYLPGPKPETYPEGGSPFEDYYAFTWGDALFVVLNVYTYTPGCHLLSTYPGLPDDWTLGSAQLDWLRQTLEQATSKWRFLLIHHPVGGAAGNDVDSAYGRGGGQAAYVGEQAIVHQMMIDYGVQTMFYGHDHVFTDMVVDGVHYTLPGSAGAPWKCTTEETGYTDYWPDSGWARVDVSPTAVHVEFLTQTNDVLYQYDLE
jgi:hypothetical protein